MIATQLQKKKKQAMQLIDQAGVGVNILSFRFMFELVSFSLSILCWFFLNFVSFLLALLAFRIVRSQLNMFDLMLNNFGCY